MAKKQIDALNKRKHTPPVITVLGHVDHGKTSLLDAIRESSIADREHGGITQKIGASSVEIIHEGEKREITFIDTPGHQAFANMRSRGATVADIGLLIVSAVDGVMPQTKESIEVLKKALIPFIVVITKVDLPTKNVEKVKQQIIREDVLLEGLGGDVPVIEVSAKTKNNIKELLDLIILVFDMHGAGKDTSPSGDFEGIVIESKIDPKSGPHATVIVKNGTVSIRDEVEVDNEVIKVRMMTGSNGAQLNSASVGDGVEMLGFTNVPSVGSIIHKKGWDKKEVALNKEEKELLPYSPSVPESSIAVILCSDTEGSMEAILEALPKEVYIVQKKTGDIGEADVLMAKSTGAIVLGFNVRLKPEIQKLARVEKVLVRTYTIIYNLLEEIEDVVEGKRLDMEEKIYGAAKIIASFPYEKTIALGVKVQEGRMAKNDKIRILRGEETIGESSIASLRSGKNPVSKVEEGSEAGIVLSAPIDFQVGDMIISHE